MLGVSTEQNFVDTNREFIALYEQKIKGKTEQ